MKKIIRGSCVVAALACASVQASLVITTDSDAVFRGAGSAAAVPIVTSPALIAPGGGVLSVRSADDGFGGSLPDNSFSQYSYIHFSLPVLSTPVSSASINLAYYLPTSPSVSGTVTLLGIAQGAAGDIAGAWVEGAANGVYSGSDIIGGNPNLLNLGSFAFGATPANGTVFSISSSQLATFLNNDANGGVTLILYRNGDNNNFGINSREAALGTPSLTIDFAAPEPATYGLIGGVFCLAIYGGMQMIRRRQTALVAA